MSRRQAAIQLMHLDPSKAMPRISKAKCDLVRRARLQAVPRQEPGLAFKGLPRRVARLLSAVEREDIGSIAWDTASVKLDLEARRLIRRLPGSRRQRLLRVR